MLDYVKSVWKLYRYGSKATDNDTRTSVSFISKAGRFYTVGASGLLVNYIVAVLFADAIMNLWYIHATIIGIIVAMSSNFILNKIWTFEDRNFEAKRTLVQYMQYAGFTSFAALVQLGMVYILVDNYQFEYALALILAVIIAAASNFILNKKWTFKEKVWS
jgi:dolichol-phosphate mannosyltransferase